MEIASGEYGDAVNKLVSAIDFRKNILQPEEAEEPKIIELQKVEAAKSLKSLTVATDANAESNKNSAKLESSKPNTSDTASIMLPKVKSSFCTISFLHSDEEMATKASKIKGFPISEFAQFWILLKRSFVTIIRDKQLTHMRLIAHVVVGALIGMIYYDVGNDASKVTSNTGCIFFTTMFIMFTAMMPTILTCK